MAEQHTQTTDRVDLYWFDPNRLIQNIRACHGVYNADTVDRNEFCLSMWHRLLAESNSGKPTANVSTLLEGSQIKQMELITHVREQFQQGFRVVWQNRHASSCPNIVAPDATLDCLCHRDNPTQCLSGCKTKLWFELNYLF
jgi:hypothetical protein